MISCRQRYTDTGMDQRPDGLRPDAPDTAIRRSPIRVGRAGAAGAAQRRGGPATAAAASSMIDKV